MALLFEYSPSRLRTNAILIWHVMYATGALLLTLMSYGERDWRMLQVLISTPSIIAVTFMWSVLYKNSFLFSFSDNKKLTKNF